APIEPFSRPGHKETRPTPPVVLATPKPPGWPPRRGASKHRTVGAAAATVANPGEAVRIESSVTSVSWIPSEAVTGPVLRSTFESGFTHYDDPPPERIDDLEAMREAGAFRFANRLKAWVDVEHGTVTGAGYSGGGLM